MNIPIKVGDKLKDTAAYGDVEIVDIYVSPRTNEIVYGVVGKDNYKYLAFIDELQPMFPV